MRDIDRTLDEALSAEERDLLRRIGEEPGYFSQALSILSGRTGWVSGVLMVVQGIAFVAGVWAAWRFFEAPDVLTALRWGLPAAVLLLMSLIMKMAMWPTIHARQLQLQLKRLEVLLVHDR